MGASGWSYFVPYQPDIQAALQKLRTAVFEDGRYYQRFPYWRGMTFDQYLPPDPDFTESDRAYYWKSFKKLQALPEPTSIETLLEWNGEEGTHSILDVHTVMDTPLEPATLEEWKMRHCPPGEDQWPAVLEYLHSEAYGSQFGNVYPLTEHQLNSLLGTTQPTREMVEDKLDEIHQLRDRWVGLYILIYEDELPQEILFAGYSGD